MNIHNLFADKSDLYAAARPQYPEEIYTFLKQVAPSHDLAWDCACGNGQVASDLARYFERVEATDVSREQISNASKTDRVSYSVSESESTPFEDGIFDLVCVGQALHWFDYERFWPELDRVLKPNGVFAAWGYLFPNVNSEIEEVLRTNFYPVIEPYWSNRNQILWNRYQDISIPYQLLDSPEFTFATSWNLDQFLMYLHTWSAVRRCMDSIGDAFFITTYEKVRQQWGDAAMRREVKMGFCFLAARKESTQ